MTPPRRTRTAPAARKAPAPRQPKVAAPAPSPEPVAALTDWELAYLALYAEDTFCAALKGGWSLNAPPPDPRLAPDWQVLGTLTAVDAPVRIGKYKVGAREVFYGWLLQGFGQRVLAIRGTQRLAEWLIDGLFAPRGAHPVAGKVESGFWGVYASMRVDGKPITDIAAGGPITVVGHSLGAALATYASLELAQVGAKVRGVFVASPHPGDKAFCQAFGAAVPDHVLYRNAADYVPRVPFWFGYADVPNVKTLSAAGSGVTITGGPAGQHHVLSYAALMDRNALASFKPLPIDQQFLDCISTRS